MNEDYLRLNKYLYHKSWFSTNEGSRIEPDLAAGPNRTGS
jgi:hypothetical protein